MEVSLSVVGLLICFLLPTAFGVYAICSNLIVIVQYAIRCARKKADPVP